MKTTDSIKSIIEATFESKKVKLKIIHIKNLFKVREICYRKMLCLIKRISFIIFFILVRCNYYCA